MPKKSKAQKTINLALQGGGSHGAFTWGVLDKLLEDGRLDVEGICATSAGTMNACCFAYGKHEGGPDKAREVLHDFWYKVHKSGERFSPIRHSPWDNTFGDEIWRIENSYGYMMFDLITRMVSPYQYNPFDFNPLRDVLEDTINFESLRKCDSTKLFISATHVATGKVRVFNAPQMDIDVALASACLPYLFKAVDIEGEDFWDGGYVGNPALYPLFYETHTRDMLIVHINPIERHETPTTAPDIMNRINEISFNSSLLQEMRAIAFVKKLLELDMLKDEHRDHFKNVLVHSIRADQAMSDLSVSSKLDSSWEFLTYLRDLGRKNMEEWLDKNFDKIGKEDSVDLDQEFLYSVTKVFEDREKWIENKKKKTAQ